MSRNCITVALQLPRILPSNYWRLAGFVSSARRVGGTMESAITSEVRELCKAVAEERDTNRMRMLLDTLLQTLNERELLLSLF